MGNGGISRPYREKKDSDWESEHDARTLAEAEEIKNDPERLRKAKNAVEYMIKDKQNKIKSFKAIKVK